MSVVKQKGNPAPPKADYVARFNELVRSQEPVSEIFEIGPSLADMMLAHQGKNRTIRDYWVKRLAREMAHGEWAVTGQSIQFSKAGKLIDGQHRLLAVLASKRIVTCVVTFGLSEDAMAKIDVGARRTPGNFFQIAGIPNSTAVAAATRWLYYYDLELMDKTQTSEFSPSPAEVLAHFNRNQDLYFSSIPATKLRKFLPVSFGTFLHFIFTRIDATQADFFFEGLACGVGLDSQSPIWVMREQLLKEQSRRKQDGIVTIATVIKAWNAYRRGKPVKLLAWRRNAEAFPVAV